MSGYEREGSRVQLDVHKVLLQLGMNTEAAFGFVHPDRLKSEVKSPKSAVNHQGPKAGHRSNASF